MYSFKKRYQTKKKKLTQRPIISQENITRSQSELTVKTSKLLEAREKASVQVEIGFSLCLRLVETVARIFWTNQAAKWRQADIILDYFRSCFASDWLRGWQYGLRLTITKYLVVRCSFYCRNFRQRLLVFFASQMAQQVNFWHDLKMYKYELNHHYTTIHRNISTHFLYNFI